MIHELELSVHSTLTVYFNEFLIKKAAHLQSEKEGGKTIPHGDIFHALCSWKTYYSTFDIVGHKGCMNKSRWLCP